MKFMQNHIPNLFIIGAPKSGTTTLYSVLSRHPQVFMCEPKEPRFFSRDSEYQKGFDWYLNNYFKNSKSYEVRGEATPTYLYLHGKTIPRIEKCFSGNSIKFIAVLRNPVDRAYSHYWFNRNTKFKHRETLSFEEALSQEDIRMNSSEFYEEGRISYAYFQTGLYAEQVSAFMGTFGQQNCLWLLFEDLLPENFGTTVQNIENFLEIDAMPLSYMKKKESVRYRSRTLAFLMRESRGIRQKTKLFLPQKFRTDLKSSIIDYNTKPFRYPEMQMATRQMLSEKYRPDIARLEKEIRRDLSNWK